MGTRRVPEVNEKENPIHTDGLASFERKEILEQLEEILVSPFFSNSKRCSAMLRFIVERTLENAAESLKERTIGVEVFHRDLEYETSMDPIVRSVAGDIRRRLAQFYQEPGDATNFRITLPLRSYVPEFHRATSTDAASVSALSLSEVEDVPVAEELVAAAAVPELKRRGIRLRWMHSRIFIAALAVVSILVVLGGWYFKPKSARERFWAPFGNHGTRVLLVIGHPDEYPGADLQLSEKPSGMDTVLLHMNHRDHVALQDAVAANFITEALSRVHTDSILQAAKSTNFSEMSQGPTVLIGGGDNPWFRRVAQALPFYATPLVLPQPFDPTKSQLIWMIDKRYPERRNWKVDYSQSFDELPIDYAIVARFRSPDTGQMTVSATGIGSNGTYGAGECLDSESCLTAIFAGDPSHGHKENIAAVIQTEVVDGRPGPPRVLAVQSW